MLIILIFLDHLCPIPFISSTGYSCTKARLLEDSWHLLRFVTLVPNKILMLPAPGEN